MSLESRIFWRASLLYAVVYWVYKPMEASLPGYSREIILFPHWCIALPLYVSVKHFGEEGYRFPGNISQAPFRQVIRTCSLVLKTTVVLVKRVWLVGARANDCMASLIHSTLSICIRGTGTGWNWDRSLSATASAFSESKQANPLATYKGGIDFEG